MITVRHVETNHRIVLFVLMDFIFMKANVWKVAFKDSIRWMGNAKNVLSSVLNVLTATRVILALIVLLILLAQRVVQAASF